jgi:phosphoribosylformimino-5-aminoimidazole carboxamide ribonucleotide (ProFAR) isomerase
MFYEFRQYKMDPAKREWFAGLMDTVVIPFQVSKGMIVVGGWVDEQDPTLYYWMRRFESEEERIALYEAVYKSDGWLNDVKPQLGDTVQEIVVKRIVPSARSIIR